MADLFRVIRGSDNQPMMSTDYESCIPWEHIESMSSAGYKFSVNGKITPKTKLKDAVSQALKSGVGFPAGAKSSAEDDASTSEQPGTSPKPVSVAKPVSKQVRCVDTGEIFKNQSEAAKHFNIDPAQVSDSIKTGRPRSGYTFERYTGE